MERGEGVYIECLFPRGAAIQGLTVEAGEFPYEVRRVVLPFEAVGGKTVEFFEIGVQAQILGKEDVKPPVLIVAEGMNFPRFVSELIAAVVKGGIFRRVIVSEVEIGRASCRERV